MYDDGFVHKLSDDFFVAALQIVKILDENLSYDLSFEDELEVCMEFYFCISAYLNSKNITDTMGVDLNAPKDDIVKHVKEIAKFYRTAGEKRQFELSIHNMQQRYSKMFNKDFVYSFSDNDFERLQVLINETRDLISVSKIIEEDHKLRLLKRLEKLQSEMHKTESNLDKFWGLFGEAGVMLGKFGSDVKPIVDRIREVLEIVCRTQAQTEQLPGRLPLALPEKDKAETN